MKPNIFKILVGLTAAVSAGCATSHVAEDHQELRRVLMDYTDDQIMDNIIRAKNDLPIVHFDVTKVDATVTSKLSATLGGGRSVTDVSSRTPSNSTVTTNQTTLAPAGQTVVNTVAGTVGVVTGVMQTIAKPFTASLSPERSNQVFVQVVPVLEKNEVYAAYEAFVNINQGDSVRDSVHNSPPPKDRSSPDAIHIARRWRNTVYWVPKKYKREFFHLCLVASVTRGTKDAAAARSVPPESIPELVPPTSSGPEESEGVKALKETADEIRRLRITPP